MGQIPEQRSTTRALLVLATFVVLPFALAVVPNAIPALEALTRFVEVPAIQVLIVAVLGPAGIYGIYVLIRGRGRQPPDT